MNELQYRFHFFLYLFHSMINLGVGLVAISLVYQQTPEINGWSRPQLLALLGVHTIIGALTRMWVQPTLSWLLRDIHEGTLDYVLTKPVDTHLLVSARRIAIWHGVDVVTGLGVMVWAVSDLGGVGPLDVAAFLLSLTLGMVIIFSFLLILTTTGFWLVRVDAMIALFESTYQAGRWPASIYPDWFRFGLTFVVPVVLAVSVPAEAVTSRLPVLVLLGEVVFAVAMFRLSRWFFRRALRHYTGASA